MKEAMKLALEALEYEADKGNDNAYQRERDAIKQALAAQPTTEESSAVQPGGRLAFAGPMHCAKAIRARSNT